MWLKFVFVKINFIKKKKKPFIMWGQKQVKCERRMNNKLKKVGKPILNKNYSKFLKL